MLTNKNVFRKLYFIMSITFEDKVMFKAIVWTKNMMRRDYWKYFRRNRVKCVWKSFKKYWPRTVRYEENHEAVEELILTQKENPWTHFKLLEITRELRISHSSASRASRTDFSCKQARKLITRSYRKERLAGLTEMSVGN